MSSPDVGDQRDRDHRRFQDLGSRDRVDRVARRDFSRKFSVSQHVDERTPGRVLCSQSLFTALH